VFERFTRPAREAVVHAQIEARSLRHGYIGTEHLLLGVLTEESGAGARALARIGMDLETARAEVVRIVGEGPYEGYEKDAEALRAIGIDVEEIRRRVEEAFGPGALDRRIRRRWGRRRRGRCEPVVPVVGPIPFTPRAKKVLELSLREAVGLGDSHIGTEHIFLGLLREGEGIAATLIEQRAGEGDVRKLVVEEIARGKDPPSRSA
jgi:ATP-dependent Clp protease ATP-binding subunit ClpA